MKCSHDLGRCDWTMLHMHSYLDDFVLVRFIEDTLVVYYYSITIDYIIVYYSTSIFEFLTLNMGENFATC